MMWSALQLRGISFLGPGTKPTAVLQFRSGLNVICGASETGKSFIVEAVDFLLGGSQALRDIPERVGYDRARLILKADETTFTVERSTSGGGFREYEGSWLVDQPSSDGTDLRERHARDRDDTLSARLLAAVGLTDRHVRRNAQGATHSLSFRDLARLVVVQENEITKQLSPLYSGQWVNKTVEYSVFKLLLTGVDDHALARPAPASRTQQANYAKVEFIDEWLTNLRAELDELGTDQAEAEEQLARLEETTRRQREQLQVVQSRLDESLARRRAVVSDRANISGRIEEIGDLLARFRLLKEHYKIDLERLAAVEESGSFFVHLDRKPCPLCGAIPDHKHRGEGCDGDVERVIEAARAEITKIQMLSAELDQTIADLTGEARDLAGKLQQIDGSFQQLELEINMSISPDLGGARTSFTEVVEKTVLIRRIVDMFGQVRRLEEQKEELLGLKEEGDSPGGVQTDLSKSVLDEFTSQIQGLLESWGFPGAHRIYFDEATADIVIDGKPRASRGKGLRAITHAAVNIGLMEFCKIKGLPHPGFVILDSPLLAYWAPEGAEDSLEGTDLKDRFYMYLADHHQDSQIVIVENEHPPAELNAKIGLTVFTKNSHFGRYGFFPI